MALVPKRIDLTNRAEVPMFRMPRYGMPQPGDFFGQPFRSLHGPDTGMYLSDMKNSRFFPNLMTVNYEGFRVKIKISMCYYKPEDVKVEVVDNFVVIEAKHEERKEKRCFVTREFKRRVKMPLLANPDEVNAKWSPYGWLHVYIPLKESHNHPDFYSPTGHQRPIGSGDKPVEPKKVRPVPIKIADY